MLWSQEANKLAIEANRELLKAAIEIQAEQDASLALLIGTIEESFKQLRAELESRRRLTALELEAKAEALEVKAQTLGRKKAARVLIDAAEDIRNAAQQLNQRGHDLESKNQKNENSE